MEADQQTSDPWPMNSGQDTKCNFDDDFSEQSPLKSADSNENGLVLPDSQKYLSYLENKLEKLNGINNKTSRDTQAKNMLKQLEAKRDGLFDFGNNSNIDQTILAEEHSENGNATNSTITDTLERKLFPHLHSINPDESKKLLNHDILNFVHNNENKQTPPQQQDNELKDNLDNQKKTKI